MNKIIRPIVALIVTCSSIGIANAVGNEISHKSDIFSVVKNPDVPLTMTFAEKTVNFDRVDMFERLDRELTSMTYTHGNTLLLIKRANRFFPEIIPLLKKHGVPQDFIYLACVESVLNIRAYSSAKAAGIWQFMSTTGKQYGLEINDYVDERYNLEKATAAACRYLKKAYAKYGNWESVATSYNGGMTRITKELESQLANSSYDLYLVDETSRYMFRILATKLIMENPAKYGFRLSSHQLYQPIPYTTEKVDSAIEDWPAWAKEKGITFAQLREMNPWIRAKSLPNKSGKIYNVKIPHKNALYRSKQEKTVYNKKWIVE